MKDIGEVHFVFKYNEAMKQQRKNELQIRVCFWSSLRDQDVSCHLADLFMRHATGEDILKKLMTCIGSENLFLGRLIMVGNDGPNVNKKV